MKISGRLEHDNAVRFQINNKLSTLPIIFTGFYSYMEADNKSYDTCLDYISYVKEFMEFVTNGQSNPTFYKNITTQNIREYMIFIRRRVENGIEIKNSDSIQATKWSAVNSFFNYLVMDDYIDTNPMLKTRRPKNRKQNEIVYLEENEIAVMIDNIKNNNKRNNLINRDIAILTLGITTGLRVSALTQINIDDINFSNNTIHVIEKGSKDRYLQFGSHTAKVLKQWISDRDKYFPEINTDALFVSQKKQRLTRQNVNKMLKKYTDGVDKNITAHCMRKTAATQACKSGADINTIANMLGHNSITTTQRYLSVLETEKAKVVNTLDGLFE